MQTDSVYKYLRKKISGTIQLEKKYVGELAVYSYHRENLSLSPEGLIMYKGSRFPFPKVLWGAY